MVYRIWLDDMRTPPPMDNLVAFTNAEDAIRWFDAGEEITDNDVFFLYLDHDLGDGLSGYDFAKWFIEWNIDKRHTMKYMLLTQNPVGAFNIRQLFERLGYTRI